MILVRADISGISGDMLLSGLVALTKDENTAKKIAEEIQKTADFCQKLAVEFENLPFGKRMDLNIEERRPTPNEMRRVLSTISERFLNEKMRAAAIKIFEEILSVEREIHGEEEIHELASADTILDIVGVLAYIQKIGEEVAYTVPKLGSGRIKCSHGDMPVPVEAVKRILKNHGIPMYIGGFGELTTPTGLAIIANIGRLYEGFVPQTHQYARGYGTRYGDENYLEIYRFSDIKEFICSITTWVDDISPEILGDFLERIREISLDVSAKPIYMKKSRMGWEVEILSSPQNCEEIARRTMKELGTLGVRIQRIQRISADRKIIVKNVSVRGKNYDVSVKVSYLNGEVINEKVEYEDIKRISEDLKIPLKSAAMEVYRCLNSENC